MVTVQPLIGDAPAVTLTVATKPPVHWFSDTVAVQPPGCCDVVVVVVVVVVVSPVVVVVVVVLVGPVPKVGVVQSRHWARLPVALLCMFTPPVKVPVLRRNLLTACWSGVRHSARLAQWLPSVTLEW